MEVRINNFNQQLRERVIASIDNYMMQGIDLKTACNLYSMYVLALGNEETMENAIMQSYILSLGYLDAYKIYSYKQKMSLNNILDEDILGTLYEIEDYDDIIETIKNNPMMLLLLIESIHEFGTSSDLTKINLVKSLSDSENDVLKNNFQIHTFDRISYDIDIDLDIIVDMYNKLVQRQEENLYSFDIAIIMQITNFIRKFLIWDRKQATKLILDIAEIDYNVSKYMSNKLDDEVLKSLIDSHIDYYENNSTNSIIDILSSDENFLYDALLSVIDLKVHKSCNNIPLDENDIYTQDSKKLELKLKKDVDK